MNRFADMPMERFVTALAAAEPTPGSGAAAAVTLALAAGCLAKACAITLRRREDQALDALAEEAAGLAAAALAGASEEAATFRAMLGKRLGAVDDNLAVAEGLRLCAGAVLDLAGRLQDRVAPIVAGDLAAARRLAEAADAILAANAAEAVRTGP